MNFEQILYQYRIIHLNIRGVRANKENLEHYLGEYNHPEIVTMNETMLSRDKNIVIKGYYCAARREPIGMSGKHGSLILVKETIKDVVELDFLKSQFQEEIIGIEIKGNKERPGLNIVTHYNPPGNRINPSIFQNSLYSNSATIFTGDLNCKNLAWGSNSTDTPGSDLLDVLDDQNWIVLNDGSKTRIDPRNGNEEVLDLIIGNSAATRMKPEFFVGDDVGSDHLPLHCDLTFGNPKPDNPVFYRNVSQMDNTRFKELINEKVSLLPQNFETARELDRIADDLPNVVKEAFEAACPLREKKPQTKPVSAPILALIKRKRRLRREKSAAMARDDLDAAQKSRERPT